MEPLGTILKRTAASAISGRGEGRHAAPAEPLCPRCQGMGLLLKAKPDPWDASTREYELCECVDTPEYRQGKYRRLLSFSRLPAESECNFDNFIFRRESPDLEVVASSVRRWAETSGAGHLLLTGSVGVGKTHLAVAACHTLLHQGRVIYFTTSAELLDTLRDAYSAEGEDSHYSLIERMKTVDVLALDDFGKERRNDFAVERLSVIIHARHAAALTTIITTNLPPARIVEWDEAAASRLMDRTRCHLVPMDGTDYRRWG